MPPSCDCIAYPAQLEDLTMVDSDSNGQTKTPLIVESYHLLSSTAAPCQSHKTRPNRPCSRGPSCAKYGPVFRLTLFLGWGSRESGVGGLWMLLNTSILQAIQVVNRTCTGGEGVVGSSLTWPSPDGSCGRRRQLERDPRPLVPRINSGLEDRLRAPEAGSMRELNGGRR